MSYLSQAKLAADQSIILRATACAVSEGVAGPDFWAQTHAWQLSAQAGWAAAYASALESGIEDPGGVEAVISDAQILSAVQAIIAAETPPEPLPDPAE